MQELQEQITNILEMHPLERRQTAAKPNKTTSRNIHKLLPKANSVFSPPKNKLSTVIKTQGKQ